MKIYEDIIHILQLKEKSVATMESCTGGSIASEITNHNGASEILKFSAVTYSNEYKIKMGVNPSVIDKYSVYSIETAEEMAKNISKFANSDFGIGITGKLNNPDPKNPSGEDDKVFICIYDKGTDTFYKYDIRANKTKTRKENKEIIINFIGEKLFDIISE